MADRKVLPLSSLLVLAHAVSFNSRYQGRKIFTDLDARQGRVHWGSFFYDKMKLRRLTDDRLSSPEELLNELSPEDILVTDTMGYPRSAIFKMFEGKAEVISAERSALSRGHSCAALAFNYHDDNNSLWRPANEIVPNYLQMSAAEEKKGTAPCT
jgi:tRNA A37 threonylcarbamoyladenosine modification protein TsaB